jgi:hypothetical protein
MTNDSNHKSPDRTSWQFTNHELKKALDAWSTLAEQPQAPAPDEQTMHDMQDLLKKLQEKLTELSKPE